MILYRSRAVAIAVWAHLHTLILTMLMSEGDRGISSLVAIISATICCLFIILSFTYISKRDKALEHRITERKQALEGET